MPEFNSEALDFRVASELFARVRSSGFACPRDEPVTGLCYNRNQNTDGGVGVGRKGSTPSRLETCWTGRSNDGHPGAHKACGAGGPLRLQ
jgi:hypothetical protein